MKRFIWLPFVLCLSFLQIKRGEGDMRIQADRALPPKIKNGIVIEEHGLKVEQAFLMFDDNTLVPETNITAIDKKILCRLIISGWTEREGRVYIGAAERIETSDGRVMMDEEDLFEQYQAKGVSPLEAEYITLSAVVTQIDKSCDHVLVKFKVWDKTANTHVNGSFKFYVQ